MVVCAADAGTAEGHAALEELCRIYWYPIYSCARRGGLAPHDAEDLTQGFFEDLLARGAIARADASRGRFRTFLLASFQNFHSHQRSRAASLKRGGGYEIVSIDAIRDAEVRLSAEPSEAETPQADFDRQWALRLVERSLDVVRREYFAAGKATVFDELKSVVWGGNDPGCYSDIASRLGIAEGAVKVAVHRLRRSFRNQLRADVARTVTSPAEVDDEIRHLIRCVGGVT
jgi:RNA polymerase sigma-70 factor (ECF subfamily)